MNPFGEALDQLHHIVNMFRGAGDVIGRLEVQCPPVVEVRLDIFVGVVADAGAGSGGLLDDAVVHVGKVHHLDDAKSLRVKIPPENVLENKGAEVTNVGVVVDRGSAGVHVHFVGHQRNERFRLSRHGVVEPDLRLRFRVAAQCGLRAHSKRTILTDACECSKKFSCGGFGLG